MTFRVIQGAGGAIMFPAALAIVVQTFALHERGRALALFFGIAGGPHRDRPDPRRLPHAVDLAGDLLGEHPRRGHRPDPDRDLEAGHGAPAGRMDYRGLALIASGVGLSVFGFQQSAIWGWGDPRTGRASRSARRCWSSSTSSSCAPTSPLIEVKHLSHPAVPGREHRARDHDAGVHPGVLLRQRVRPDRASARRPRRPACAPVLLHRLRRSRRRSAGGCSTGSGPSARSCSAARSAPSASGCGRGRSPASTSAPSSGTSSSPEPAWDSCSARPAPTPSTAPRGSPTARRRASPRRSATTPPAWASRSSARSSSRSCTRGVTTSLISQGARQRARARRGVEHLPVAAAPGGSIASIPHFVRLDFAYATRSVLT